MLARRDVRAPFVRPLLVAIALVIAGATASSIEAASISGTVFNDLNGNGAFNPGEPGLTGVTIELDTGADSTVDSTTTTDASGNYTFPGLTGGAYRVRQVVPLGAVQTTANPADLSLSSTDDATGVNFGNFFLITISGVAFNDANGNGTQNPGEFGLAGVTIQLDIGANGSVDATTTTDVSGNYSFTNLGPGTYRVRQVVPAGRAQTSPDPADIVATSGSDVSGVNFGSILSAVITVIPTLDQWMLVLLAVALAGFAAVRLTR